MPGLTSRVSGTPHQAQTNSFPFTEAPPSLNERDGCVCVCVCVCACVCVRGLGGQAAQQTIFSLAAFTRARRPPAKQTDKTKDSKLMTRVACRLNLSVSPTHTHTHPHNHIILFLRSPPIPTHYQRTV